MTDQRLPAAERELLAAVLDTFLPGSPEWPAATDLHLLAETIRLAGLSVAGLAPLRTLLAALPAGFAARGPDQREAALTVLAESEPAGFGAALQAAYNAYYIDPRVLAIVAAKTGYRPGAPQPDGHELPPFDEALIATARTRAPHWRQA